MLGEEPSQLRMAKAWVHIAFTDEDIAREVRYRKKKKNDEARLPH
jgi:hypothetical protein